jgi:hypothetical protein
MDSEGKNHPIIKGDKIIIWIDFAGMVMCVIWLYYELGKQRTKKGLLRLS